MKDRVRPPFVARILGPFIFIVGAPIALIVFFRQCLQLVTHWTDEAMIFDKGAFYLLGVGLGMMALGILTVQEGWFNRSLSETQATLVSRLAILGVALIPITPNAVHFFADKVLLSEGYIVCEKASHQWRFIRDIVYIKPTVECSSGLRDRFR